MNSGSELILRVLGEVEYTEAQLVQRAFTGARHPQTPDEIWLLSHPAVFTLGQAGKREHILDAGSIPIAQSDRGGQVTYHGPGQLVVYTLFDLRRHHLGVRSLVMLLEDAVIAELAAHGVAAASDRAAPGVYVAGAKIAALGLRVRRGCSYHGLALNVSLDLGVYDRINPCGYADMPVTSTEAEGILMSEYALGESIATKLEATLGLDRSATIDHLPAITEYGDAR